MTLKINKELTMKPTFRTAILALVTILATACEDISDLAIDKVAAPVVAEVEDISANAVAVTFMELDKSGILNKDVGIISTPVPNLSIDVFASGSLVGTFTTDANGIIEVAYAGDKPNEFAGTYKGTAFRIIK